MQGVDRVEKPPQIRGGEDIQFTAIQASFRPTGRGFVGLVAHQGVEFQIVLIHFQSKRFGTPVMLFLIVIAIGRSIGIHIGRGQVATPQLVTKFMGERGRCNPALEEIGSQEISIHQYQPSILGSGTRPRVGIGDSTVGGCAEEKHTDIRSKLLSPPLIDRVVPEKNQVRLQIIPFLIGKLLETHQPVLKTRWQNRLGQTLIGQIQGMGNCVFDDLQVSAQQRNESGRVKNSDIDPVFASRVF